MTFRERMNTRSFPWVVVGILAVAAAPVGLLAWISTAIDYRTSPPPCYGIGWGCSLSPGAVGGVIGGMWLFGVGVWAGVLAITELFWERFAVARSVATLMAGGAGLVGAAFIYLWGTG